ncbi:hypothetical protein ALI144C_45335 [Actinosynnema sp. ALI-1.44]|nr:hypothetical protein ALI144C_45335 [Actinosynnema sp. ALI-1.44]
MVVLVTGSGQARGAGTTLRRLVVRFVMLAGFTAVGWLATTLLTSGTASADPTGLLKIPGITADQSQHQKPARAPAKKSGKSGTGGLVDGLLSQVTSTVDNTLVTVTTTVTSTVDTVTKTVVTTVDGVVKTVTTVVGGVAQIPSEILTPQPSDDGDTGDPLPDKVKDLLKQKAPSQQPKDTAAHAAVETPAVAVAPAAEPAAAPTAPAVDAPVTEHPRLRQEARRTTQLSAAPVPQTKPVAVAHMVAPGDNTPGPRPGPSAPIPPAAPAPTASAGGNGGSDGRSALAVLTPHTPLVAPQAGLPHRDEAFAEVSRSAGLPATPPD